MILDSFEITVAIRTLWGEARGEGDPGLTAVEHVLFNRLKDGRWGSMLGSVCLWPYQFSCWNFSDPNRQRMISFAVEAIELMPEATAFNEARAQQDQGIDATGGATHYYADTMAAPNWADRARGAIQTAHIGHHIFFRGVK